MMTVPFKSYASTLRDPIVSAATVTPDDGTDLTFVTRAIYLGSAGNLRVTLASGETVTFPTMPAGWHPMRVTRVWSAGTSAGSIVACA